MAIWRSARGAPSRSTSSHLHAGEPLGQLGRVGDRRAREQEARVAAVGAREPPQAAQHVRHVRAEHAAVDVRLVDHDPGEVGEHVAPGAVVRQHAHVEHVRVREDQVRALADGAALLARRVAVVDRVAQVLAADRARGRAPGPGRAPSSGRGRRRARPTSLASVSSTGRLKASDFPLAVPVVTIAWPRRAASSASAWCAQSASIPAAASPSRERRVEVVRESARRARPARARARVATSSSSRPGSSTASQGYEVGVRPRLR